MHACNPPETGKRVSSESGREIYFNVCLCVVSDVAKVFGLPCQTLVVWRNSNHGRFRYSSGEGRTASEGVCSVPLDVCAAADRACVRSLHTVDAIVR